MKKQLEEKSMKPKSMSLDTTHQLYRSIEGKMEVITVWLLPETNSWLVNHRGCWQVWDSRAVWDNWHSTKKEALRQEIIARRRMLDFSYSTLKGQQQVLKKLLCQQDKINKE